MKSYPAPFRPFVCTRPFFRHPASKKRLTATAVFTLVLAVMLAAVLIGSQAVYAVYYNGVPIGSVGSMKEVKSVVTDAQVQLRELLGHDYALDDAISVAAAFGSETDGAENIKSAILENVDGVAELYVLEVDGVAVGASDDPAAFDTVLDEMLSAYTNERTTSARFLQTITVRSRFIGEDFARESDEVRTLLDPENTASSVRLTVETTERTVYTEAVPYSTSYYTDAELYEGTTRVVTGGIAGEQCVEVDTLCVNGVPKSSQIAGITVTVEPVTEVKAVGSAPRPVTASTGAYIWPAEGVVTSGFGPRTGFGSSNHQGIDIGSFYGEDIVAADGGEVVYADWCGGYGLLVKVQHDDGDVTYYGHCCEVLVTPGERVAQGQVIAHMGETGVASGVHLHFEIRVDGTPVDPATLLP